MPRSALHLLPFALAIAPLALSGCPAKTGGPAPDPVELGAGVDLAMARYDLSVPDLAASGDLAKPGDASALVDGSGLMDLVDAIDVPPAVLDGPGADLRGPDLSLGDGALVGDGGAADLARADGGAAGDLVMQPDFACLPTATFTDGRGFAGGVDLNLQPNVPVNVAANQTVTFTARTTPSGANPTVHAIYATNANFVGQKDEVFTFDANPPQNNKPPNGTDQWFIVLPGQPAGTHVWVYLRADSCDKKTLFLPGNANYEYIAQ